MRMILAILGALMLGITAVISAIPAQAQEVDCDDFDSQADAQAHLRTNPSAAAGLGAEVDGLACESLPGPTDLVPVTAAIAAAATATSTTPEATSTTQATAVATATPTTAAASSPLPSTAGDSETPRPTSTTAAGGATAATATPTTANIRAPSTGDAGLSGQGSDAVPYLATGLLLAAFALGAGSILRTR